MSGDVAAFIRARLDEDGQLARAASRDGEAWAYTGTGVYVAGTNHPIAVGPWDGELPDEGPHIARHDPARVLRQVEAMRATVQLHSGVHECPEWNWLDPDFPDDPRETVTGWSEECPTLRALSSIWSDHPEYQEGWAT